MTSIRRYLLIVSLSLICLANFLAALHGYRNSMTEAEAIIDAQLIEKNHMLLRLWQQDHQLPPDLFKPNSLFQLWQQNQLAASSPNAEQPLNLDNQDQTSEGSHFISYQGHRWRIHVSKGDTAITIITGMRYASYAKLTERVLLEAIYPIIWVLPLIGVLLWLIISLGLHPLRKLARLLASRPADNLSPLSLDDYPEELKRVVGAINQLLQRLEGAFSREKQFSANTAHELRTPIATLKLGLHQLSAQQAPSQEDITRLQHSANRMAHSIEQLLALHRLSQEQFRHQTTRCPLDKICRQVISDLYSALDAKSQQISLDASSLAVEGDEFSLYTLLRNLIDNASKYAPNEANIHIKMAAQPTHVEITVEDSGPGIPEQEYSKVMDRFYRSNRDRQSQDRKSQLSGSGLGMSIVANIVKLHHGNIQLSQSQQLGGLCVRVCLPHTLPYQETLC